ncbi:MULTISPECIES: restriction endonuclease subunit S [Clostridium]|uniref:restriction endonuclease subunit S n=2 Tax=Clostridiaceae TaxID=31979 RepID=UPI0032ECBC06
MKAQDLKNSVLQLAIQGKLVEQNPNDEPASVLIEKIKAEKEQLIKEKKIKKEKPLPEISEEEKPFEIPDNWQWVRLGDIGSWGSGATPSRSNPSYYGGKIPWLKTGELKDGYINSAEEFITEEALNKTSVKLNKVGSVLIAMYGATIGRLGILNIEATTNQACCACNTFTGIYNKYLFYYLLSQREELKSKSEGGAQPNISKEKIIRHLMTLPPLEEQKRIVAKIEEVLEKIEEYDKAEKELSKLEKAFPQDMKKSILQYAIQGKLVEQNSNDEPASILLEKIRAEKEQLIKEKKIKREKPLPKISEEEKPFEIPDSWEWVRLGECVKNIKGVTFKKNVVSEKYKDGYDFILRGGNINSQNGQLEFLDNIYIPKEIVNYEQYIKCGDTLMVASSGTKSSIAKSTYINKEMLNTSVGAFLYIIRPSKFVCSKYINLLIRYFRQKIINTTSGTNISNVSKGILDAMVIPVPPLEEQNRIVEKVDNLMLYFDRLENTIYNQDLINKLVQPKSIEVSDLKELINN